MCCDDHEWNIKLWWMHSGHCVVCCNWMYQSVVVVVDRWWSIYFRSNRFEENDRLIECNDRCWSEFRINLHVACICCVCVHTPAVHPFHSLLCCSSALSLPHPECILRLQIFSLYIVTVCDCIAVYSVPCRRCVHMCVWVCLCAGADCRCLMHELSSKITCVFLLIVYRFLSCASTGLWIHSCLRIYYIIIHICMCLVVTVLYAPWPLCGQYYYTLTDLEWMALSRSSLLFYLESPLFLLARFLIRLNGPAPVYIETHFFPISCVAIWRCAARDCWCCRRRPPASVLGYEMIVCECNFMLFFGESVLL